MKKFLSVLFVTFFMTACSTLEVSVDYDEAFDFSKAQKFIVVHEHKVSEDSLLNDRIIRALNSNLRAKNYTKVTKDKADLIFVFYTKIKDKTQNNPDNYSVGMGYGFGGMILSTSTTSAYNYTEGTLIVDALHPQTKKIVWRGKAIKKLKKNETPQEKTESINKIINKIMEKFPTKKAK